MRALTALLLALLALAAPACGGDDDEPSSSSEPSGNPAVQGKGYGYEVPTGFRDASEQSSKDDELEFGGLRPDTLVITKKPAGGFATNVNIVRETGVGDVDVDQYVEASMRFLRDPELFEQQTGESLGLAPKDFSEVAELELDGEAARSLDYSIEQQGRAVRVRNVFAVRDGVGYNITLTALDEDFDDGLERLEEVTSSWRWD